METVEDAAGQEIEPGDTIMHVSIWGSSSLHWSKAMVVETFPNTYKSLKVQYINDGYRNGETLRITNHNVVKVPY